MEAAEKAEICIATEQKISRNNTYRKVVDSLFDADQSNVVLAFLKDRDVDPLQLQVVFKQLRSGLRHLTWVLAYPYDLSTEQFIVGGAGSTIRSFKGSLAIKPEEVIPDDFQRHMTSSRISNNQRNPWFKEYIENTFNCSTTGNCDGSEGITPEEMNQNGFLIEGVIESVKVIATGIDNLRKQKCGPLSQGLCAEFLGSDPDQVRDAIRDVTFIRKDGSTFKFDNDNAVVPTFEIWNYRFNETDRSFQKVSVSLN